MGAAKFPSEPHEKLAKLSRRLLHLFQLRLHRSRRLQ